MTDIELAKKALSGHTIALCRDGDTVTSDKRGVAPMVDFICEGRDLRGYSAADKIVGKAAAVLFIKAGIKEVFAEVISKSAKETLSLHGVPSSFGKETERIINREGTGLCPMETAVSEIDDIDTAFEAICRRLDSLRGAKK